MKPELVFIFRHGPSDRAGFLTPEGLAMIRDLGKRLRTKYRLDINDTYIIHSGQLRALETAQALLPEVGEIGVVELFSNDRICDTNGALDMVKMNSETVRNLIVITHLEMAARLPEAFGKEVLGVEGFPAQNVLHGQGWVIDCRQKTCDLVRA